MRFKDDLLRRKQLLLLLKEYSENNKIVIKDLMKSLYHKLNDEGGYLTLPQLNTVIPFLSRDLKMTEDLTLLYFEGCLSPFDQTDIDSLEQFFNTDK
mgnify:CR=1 FL=1